MFRNLIKAAVFGFVLVAAGAQGQTQEPAKYPANTQFTLCKEAVCTVVSLPRSVGRVRSLQYYPMVRSSAMSVLVDGSRGYALCAIPVWTGSVQCTRVNAQPLAGVRFSIFPLANGTYTIGAKVSHEGARSQDYRGLVYQFQRAFEGAKSRLDSRIEEKRPVVRAMTPLQIASDSLTVQLFAAKAGCPSGTGDSQDDDCEPVVVDCPKCNEDPDYPDDPYEPWEPGDEPSEGGDNDIGIRTLSELAQEIIMGWDRPCVVPGETQPQYLTRAVAECTLHVRDKMPWYLPDILVIPAATGACEALHAELNTRYNEGLNVCGS